MNDVSLNAARIAESQEPTTAFAKLAPPVPVTPARRYLALVPGTTSHLTDDLRCLLEYRLLTDAVVGYVTHSAPHPPSGRLACRQENR